MKIVIFVQQLECMGGIERVVVEHLRIFAEHGCQLVLMVERPVKVFRDRVKCPIVELSSIAELRFTQLRSIFHQDKPDYLIFHGVSHFHAKHDLVIANEFSIRSICVIHFAFPGNMLSGRSYNSWQQFLENGELCSAFVAVSGIDAKFWRALGKRCFHVQNPFVSGMENIVREENDVVTFIWIGRMCEQKRPDLALAAFHKVERCCPNVCLIMIGGPKSYKKGRVEYVKAQPDLRDYWNRADVHLLTSGHESFCLVWAEAKNEGIPTVMFDLPYLDLAKDKRGYISVEQRNVDRLAEEMIRLVRDRELRLRLGNEAKASLTRFNDASVWKSWEDVFGAFDDNRLGYEVDEDLRMIVKQVYEAVKYDKEEIRWPEEMAYNYQLLTGLTLRPLARGLWGVVNGIRWFKRMIRTLANWKN